LLAVPLSPRQPGVPLQTITEGPLSAGEPALDQSGRPVEQPPIAIMRE
jgi:hypothetical protein